jgi:hypothetical protein
MLQSWSMWFWLDFSRAICLALVGATSSNVCVLGYHCVHHTDQFCPWSMPHEDHMYIGSRVRNGSILYVIQMRYQAFFLLLVSIPITHCTPEHPHWRCPPVQTTCSTASYHFFNWRSAGSPASHADSISLLLLTRAYTVATRQVADNHTDVHGPALRITMPDLPHRPPVWLNLIYLSYFITCSISLFNSAIQATCFCGKPQ